MSHPLLMTKSVIDGALRMTEETGQNSSVPVRIYDPAVFRQIEQLRRRAWAADGEVPEFILRQDILSDSHDVHGMHWAILSGGRPIAASRMCIHDTVESSPDPEALEGYEHLVDVPFASLTRLVVDPAHRGRRLSVAMDAVRLATARERGCKAVISVGELEFRIKGLERLGFRRLGPTRIRYLSSATSYVLLLELART